MTQQPGYWFVAPENTVEPGQTVDIHVGMTSPPDERKLHVLLGSKE